MPPYFIFMKSACRDIEPRIKVCLSSGFYAELWLNVCGQCENCGSVRKKKKFDRCLIPSFTFYVALEQPLTEAPALKILSLQQSHLKLITAEWSHKCCSTVRIVTTLLTSGGPFLWVKLLKLLRMRVPELQNINSNPSARAKMQTNSLHTATHMGPYLYSRRHPHTHWTQSQDRCDHSDGRNWATSGLTVRYVDVSRGCSPLHPEHGALLTPTGRRCGVNVLRICV